MGPYGSYLIETVAMLAVVSALAFFAMVLAKRMGIGRAHGPIELVGHLPLDARRGLYLVKVGSRVFLVGVGEGGFSKLGEVPAHEVPTGEKAPAGFAELFSRALAKKAPHVVDGPKPSTPDHEPLEARAPAEAQDREAQDQSEEPS